MVTGGNMDDPLVYNIAKQMGENLPAFMKSAAEWNAKYANGDAAPTVVNDSTYPNFMPWQEYVTDKAAYRQKYANRYSHLL